MSAAARLEPPRILRSSPGRLRLALPGWDGTAAPALERRILRVPGVHSASARPATGNLIVTFDPAVTATDGVMAVAAAHQAPPPPDAAPRPPAEPPAERGVRATGRHAAHSAAAITGVLRDQAGRFGRARIAVRGIDRDPQLAHRVVSMLERRPEVRRAVASATTGRVLVEFSGRVTSLQDLLAAVSDLELPDTLDEDRPAHPLDPAPVFQSGARAVGSALGLALVALRSATGGGTEPAAAPVAVAGVLGIIDGAPPLREGLRGALGRDRAQLLLGGAAIASLTLSGSPLGLLVSGAGALRVFTEARLRRAAWRDYEGRLSELPSARPGEVVRLEVGARVPLAGRVIEGHGTVIGADGLPRPAPPGAELDPGARLLRGPLTVELQAGEAWSADPRPAPPAPDLVERYIGLLGPASLAYALLFAARRRSLGAAFTGLLLVNPRAAVIGAEAADTGASARVLRAGVTVVGTRPDRPVRRPGVLVIDGSRVLSSGLEQTRISPAPGHERAEVAEIVAAMAAAAGAPWGAGQKPSRMVRADDVAFDGIAVTATVSGRRLRLGPPVEPPVAAGTSALERARKAGELSLVLSELQSGAFLGAADLRPKLAAGVRELVTLCAEQGIELALLDAGDSRAGQALADRAGIALVAEADPVDLVRRHQQQGARVAVLSDSPSSAPAFAACDLAIGLSSGRSSQFHARADLLAPGVPAVLAILRAAGRRQEAVTASVALSLAANVAGGAWGLSGEPGLRRASLSTYVAALGAIGWGWQRLRGGRRSRSVVSRLSDPRPERWGTLEPDRVLAVMKSGPDGLSAVEADARFSAAPTPTRRNAFVAAMGEQLESPLVAVLGVGAAISLAVGAVADVAIIGAVVVANAAVGAWQERQAGQAAQALQEISAATARVVRDGRVLQIAADRVVRGDVLLLQAGDRVVADARLLESDALELDEASLTGESLPVVKAAHAEERHARVVLEGSDVTVGTARAVVVAVGAGTRLGATAAALAIDEDRSSPLGERLDRLFRQGLPVVIGGGLIVTLAGIAWGGALLPQLAVGASVAVAAVPEGLPLLAGVAEAAVARRLAGRSALVRRLSAVESLGRVDVVCADKTGTLTTGRLALTVIDSVGGHGEQGPDATRPGAARDLLRCAALACPPPESPEASAHATDMAVLAAAGESGLKGELGSARQAEAPFDPVRALHATLASGTLSVKGAAETLTPRCTHALNADGHRMELNAAGRQELLQRAERLAARGLRVLMVAEGPAAANVDDPQGLTARGFLGISDPPRPGAAAALERCRAAGIRVVMLTGDHPATAGRIAAELGLMRPSGLTGAPAVLTGDELEDLHGEDLRARIESAAVIARITPIDKLRIVESLREAGHTVAMTGDGVNDAPALRLADVGVAMGRGGTEVARQAADLVLADDRFETLTEALIEGRSLWGNLHRSLGLLLGGNLGEIGLMVGATVLGRGAVLGARQILVINLITDVLPAIAVAVQPPGEHDLAELAREGTESFDRRLLGAIIRRGLATGVPSLAAVLAAPLVGAQATTVAFGSIILTQLAQTLLSGPPGTRVTRPVLAAAGGSAGVLAATLAVPSLRGFLALPAPNAATVLLTLASAPAAVIGDRLLAGADVRGRSSSALEQHARSGILLRGDAPEQQQQALQGLGHARLPGAGGIA